MPQDKKHASKSPKGSVLCRFARSDSPQALSLLTSIVSTYGQTHSHHPFQRFSLTTWISSLWRAQPR
jgi:hypothetical protein